jgi:hypothetical protein
MIKIVEHEGIRDLKDDELFFVRKNNNVFGLFKKTDSKFRLASKKLLSLNLSILPKGFNDSLLIATLMFKYRRETRKAFLKVSRHGNHLNFYFILFDSKDFIKVEERRLFGDTLKKEILTLRESNPYHLGTDEAISLIEGIIPKNVLNYLRNKVGVLLIEVDDEIDFIPFELLTNRFNVVINRLLPSGSGNYNRKGFNTLSILSNGWDEKFSYTLSEGVRVFELSRDFFKKVEFVSHRIELSEFIKFMNSDVVFFSSHADSEGVDLGNVKLNNEVISLVNSSPRVLIFNNCYFEGLYELVKFLISKGANYIVSAFSKVPDSGFTSLFIENFFYVFSRTFDVNLAMFIASRIGKSRKIYNHLLYRVYIPMKVG